MEGNGLRHPRADCGASDIVVAEHRDARNLVQINTEWGTTHRTLGIQQTTQSAVAHRLQIDLIGDVLDPHRAGQRHVVTSGADHQVIVIAGVALPLAAAAGDGGQLLRIGVRPFQRLALRSGVGAQILAHHRQVPQVVGALGVHLLGPNLVTAAAVQRGRGQQQHEGEEQGLGGDEPDAGGHQRYHHADDQNHDHDWHGPPQEGGRHHPR
ncbi:Uncharacterised protein [Mycobacteroides abscessus subsp. massiliense]|nr:Uncharacterised protein [Mycobacteroides abscessus subsp. massiliense]SKV41866.1 Uncharacterised protein [Mycobacteroides abscessus subsp. massiliense]